MIRLKGITNQWNSVPMLQDVTLSVEEGSFLGLFGKDDAGKTTLLHIIMGFLNSYSGEVKVMGLEPHRAGAKMRENVRFVPDDILWETGITAAQYLEYARSASPEYDLDRQEELCREFEVELGEEVLGMTYRHNKIVQIIAAICAKPRLLVLDEPVNFLGKEFYRKLLGHLESWNREEKMTILMAAEKYEHVDGYCTDFAYLKEGKIVAAGKAPKREERKKAVTTFGGRAALLDKYLGEKISEYHGRTVYLYHGADDMLLAVLYKAECADFMVETLSLEEDLDKNYERWE